MTQAGSSYVGPANPATLISSQLDNPIGVAVDASGNVYIADPNDNAIKEWNAATQTLSTLISSGLNNPYGVAVDGCGQRLYRRLGRQHDQGVECRRQRRSVPWSPRV